MTLPVPIHFMPASTLGLAELADLYTRTFADYTFPITVRPDHLARVIAVEHLDLDRSPILLVGDEPVGLATVGLRGDQAYCRGFGIVVPYRGRGLAAVLAEEMVRQARQAGAVVMTLGVLKNNPAAVQTYRRVGFRPWRDLQTVEWRRGQGAVPSPAVMRSLTSITPASVLDNFATWRPTPAIWYRDLPSLRAQPDLTGLALVEGERVIAYALLHTFAPDAAEIVDMGMAQAEHGAELVAALQAQHHRLVLGNEPVGTLALKVCRAAGFVVTAERYEMALDLNTGAIT